MLVQLRGDRYRLIRQHDHALAAGELAAAWRGPGDRSAPLPFRTVLATSLHDLAWRELDGAPRLDPASGRPCAFHDHPLDEKLAAYARGLDAMEGISPWIGLAGSLHYASFLEGGGADDFLASERERRERLARRLRARSGGGDPVADVREGLRWLKAFDGFSIRLCLSPPPVPDEALPSWLDRSDPVEMPDGTRIELSWRGEREVRVKPWPFGPAPALEIPYRDLPARRYPDARTLREGWRSADEATWALRLSPPAS